jgi:HAD superfamily hydrolase (TIGR01509 family)
MTGSVDRRDASRAGIVFDVDGTLLDTNYLHVLAWSRALADQGLRVPMSVIHSLIGMGSDKLIEHLVPGHEPSELDEGHSRHYSELRGEIRAFDGAAELLKTVAGRGATVILGTSAKSDELEAMLATLAAGDAISHVVSSGDVESTKPDPDIFATALERSGLAVEDLVVVGDSVWDVEAALRLGLRCVTVRTGGIAAEALRRAGALAVYDDVAALLAELDRSPLRAVLLD